MNYNVSTENIIIDIYIPRIVIITSIPIAVRLLIRHCSGNGDILSLFPNFWIGLLCWQSRRSTSTSDGSDIVWAKLSWPWKKKVIVF